MVKLLDAGLNTTRPDGLLVRTQMSLRLGLRTRVEPDILVLVAPISEIRDRELKPKIYAATGITHFWRVEEDAGRPTIYVYELDPATATYFLTGTHQEQRLVLTVPYAIEIDLSRLDTGI
jgi:hypothetical protein